MSWASNEQHTSLIVVVVADAAGCCRLSKQIFFLYSYVIFMRKMKIHVRMTANRHGEENWTILFWTETCLKPKWPGPIKASNVVIFISTVCFQFYSLFSNWLQEWWANTQTKRSSINCWHPYLSLIRSDLTWFSVTNRVNIENDWCWLTPTTTTTQMTTMSTERVPRVLAI